MSKTDKADFYRKQLRHIGAELVKLSGDDHYIDRLVRGYARIPLDQALKDFIEQFGD